MSSGLANLQEGTISTLPGDDVRQIMWRFTDRYDLQMIVQSARAVARGPVARLVAEGARNSHEWTSEKDSLLKAFDEAGITAVFLDPEHGGFLEGPKNLALALVAFELAWVDAGAATSSLANCLALAPIHERGTAEQRDTYFRRCAPPAPGEDREIWRGAFALTEPLPYVGVDTGLLGGKVRIAEWQEGQEPVLQVDKRGRFITNMAFARFVTAAVDSADPRIKGSCMVILEETDPGSFDRGNPARKLVHQLSSTRDPAFNLRVPASRIIGGYEVKDGVIVPNYSHGEVIEAVFKRTRVTVGLMTSAKLLSAVEPVIRYHRGRFRGGETASPGSPRYDLGLQMKEDVLHRLVDIWATGEASASLGFAAARLFDELDPLERRKEEVFAAQKVGRGTAVFKALRRYQKEALDRLQQGDICEDPMLQFVLVDSLANVLCPACKLWNTGHGANMMREAVSLMGGYGITEDCPGFLGHKWMDAQLEATYEGPEAVQRRQLSVTMTNELFLAQFHLWIAQMREIASRRPGTGACTLATAMQMWLWALNHLQKATDPSGAKLYHSSRHGVTFPLADALCWLVAARQLVLDVLELEEKAAANPVLAEGSAGLVGFYTDLCHVQCARAAGEAGRILAELVFGYRAHPAWSGDASACYGAEELVALEGVMPGLASTAVDVVGADGSHPSKAGPCARFDGVEQFVRLRAKLDGCLTGAHLAKDRAADALAKVMIPEALDYPRMSGEVPIERQTMEVDIVSVGFGPAMGGFLTTLSRGLVNPDGSPAIESKVAPGLPLQVLCYERADDIGFGVSGVVTKARGIRSSFPELDPAQIPMAAEVRNEKVLYLLDPVGASRRSKALRAADRLIRGLRHLLPYEADAVELPYTPEFLHKQGGLVLSVGQFTQWVGEQVMATGVVQVWPGTPVAQALTEDGRVAGVRLVDQGVDRAGNPEAGFLPGMDIRASLTVVGDGPFGPVGRQLDEHFGLPHGHHRKDWAVGAKLVIDLPESSELEPGTVYHTFGYPEPEIFGFLYVHPGRVASVGIFVPSWFDSPMRTSYRYLQYFVQHPYLWRLLRGGTLRSWGAKTLQESGRIGEPHLVTDGCARIGEGSGSTNVLTGSGVDEAWTTGVQLAEGVLELAREGSPFTKENLERAYVSRRRASWVEKEGRIAERARIGFHSGLIRGLVGMALAGMTRGKLAMPGEARSPQEHTPSFAEYYKGRVPAEEVERIRRGCLARGTSVHEALMERAGWPAIEFDGKLLISHQDALLVGGKVQAPPGYADHVAFLYPNLCETCGTRICVEICSGEAITAEQGGPPQFDREKCVHCGACVWNCSQTLPDDPNRTNIEFRAGTGGLHSTEN